MSDNSSTMATFMRVESNGDLVFRNPLTHEIFAVEFSSELYDAVLKAQKIVQEASESKQQEPENRDSEPTLPIATIQTLIRSGRTPENIVETHHVSLSTVRRFAGPVEVEKKYAIQQFLATTLPQDNANAKVQDVIYSNLASIGADFSTLSWSATRQPHSPWQIEATYTVRSTHETALWLWSLRDHSVVCVNTPAKRLLGEIANQTSPIDKELFSSDASAPSTYSTGNFPVIDMRAATRSQRTAMSVAATTASAGQSDVSAQKDDPEAHTSEAIADIISRNDHEETAQTRIVPPATSSRPTPSAPSPQHEEQKTYAEDVELDFDVPESGSDAEPTITTDTSATVDQPAETDKASDASPTPARKQRSSVPKWEDIIFGSR